MKQILSSEPIRTGVRELAERLTTVYGERPITIVAILTGSLVLLADHAAIGNAAPCCRRSCRESTS